MKMISGFFVIMLIFILYVPSLFGQDKAEPDVICIKDYYKGYGVIFPADFAPKIQSNENVGLQRFTPTIKQIKRAENLLFEQYNSLFKDVDGYENVANVKSHFYEWYRQYIGYIEKDGDNILTINLLNFGNKRKAKRKFEGWEEMYFVGFDGFYSKNLKRIKVNLNQGELNL